MIDAVGAGDGDFALFGDKIGSSGFEQVRGGVEHFLAHGLRGERRRAARKHHAAAGIGAGAAGDGGAVAMHDADILEADAEMFGNDLRQCRFKPLAVRGDAEGGGHRACRIDADDCRLGAGIDRHARRD